VLLSDRLRSALVLFAVVLGVVGAPGRAAARDWPNADLVAQAELPLPADHLTAKLSDLAVHKAVWTGNCSRDWTVGSPGAGVGATAHMTYAVDSWRRELDGRISRVVAPILEASHPGRVDLDHAGKKGFQTVWTLTPVGPDRTRVEVHTYLSTPPWPVRRAYYNGVQPKWSACHASAIQALGTVAAR
jgi:hypothetical protein